VPGLPTCRCGADESPGTAAARGPVPVRQYLRELVDLIGNGTIDPGKVFDLELPLDEAAAGYRAMDERRSVRALLRP
jgi:threonine dehydrogenase-like Zn-dependent dehydrogenase